MPLTTTEVAIAGPVIAVLGSWWIGKRQQRYDEKRRREDFERENERRGEEAHEQYRRQFLDEKLKCYVAYGAQVSKIALSMKKLLDDGTASDQMFMASETLMKLDLLASDEVRTSGRRLWLALGAIFAFESREHGNSNADDQVVSELSTLHEAYRDAFYIYTEECRNSIAIRSGA